ncbi:MAG: hypothetical protein ACWGNO_04540 [Desulfobacterales bacterium]
MQKDAVSYVYKDFGSNYFGDFEIQFEAAITASDSGGQMVLCCISDIAGTKQDQFDGANGIWAGIYNSGGLIIELVDGASVHSDTYNPGGSTLPLTYFTFSRSGSTIILKIYSDSGRTVLIDTLSASGASSAKQYMEVIASRDAAGSETITGYTQNFDIIYDVSQSDEFGINDFISNEQEANVLSADGFGISDFIDSLGGTVEKSTIDTFGIDDSVSAAGDQQASGSDEFGLSDFSMVFQSIDSANGEFGINDNIQGGYEFNVPTDADDLGVSDLTNALNWTEFLRENPHNVVKKFFCTLTGTPDGLSDVELPISSFQARKRDGEATFASAVVPGIDYFDQISDRPNGQIVIEMAYFVDGTEQFREEIIRVNLEDIRYDKGARNRSISISGHRTESFGVNEVDLEGPSYKYISEGKLRYRFPIPDPWLNPGDTCRVSSEGDEFRVDYITYVVSAAYKFMEVSEA